MSMWCYRVGPEVLARSGEAARFLGQVVSMKREKSDGKSEGAVKKSTGERYGPEGLGSSLESDTIEGKVSHRECRLAANDCIERVATRLQDAAGRLCRFRLHR